jgi:hypothetical protein
VTVTSNEIPFEEEERVLYTAVATKYADEFDRMDAKVSCDCGKKT